MSWFLFLLLENSNFADFMRIVVFQGPESPGCGERKVGRIKTWGRKHGQME